MADAFKIVKLTALDLWDDILLLVLFNLIWCLTAVLILPIPFFTAGLAWSASIVGDGRVIKFRTFFEGGRRFLKTAYIWGLINLMVWSLLLLNINFYSGVTASWAFYVEIVFVALSVLWLLLQMYVFPFLIIQEVPSLKEAYRNSFVLLIMRPALTIVVFVVLVLMVVISYLLVFPLVTFCFAFLALLGNRAVVETIKAERKKDGSQSLIAP